MRGVTKALLVVTVLSGAAPAQAFCVTRTCPSSAKQVCETIDECSVEGPVLFWPTRVVTYSIQRDDSLVSGLSHDALGAVVGNAFRRWLEVDCAGEHPSLELVRTEDVACHRAEYNQTQPNANIVMFRDERWPYENAKEVLGLTTLMFSTVTGEIYDADIQINTSSPAGGQGISLDGSRANDLNDVLSHETGHFLGLSHSQVPSATMFHAATAGMDTLETDDIAGICAALPPDRPIRSSSTEPRHGFSGSCGTEQSGCCQSAVGRTAPSIAGLWWFGLGLSAWLGRARFKRSRPQTARALRR